MTDKSKIHLDLQKLLQQAADVGAKEALMLCHIKINTFFAEAINEVHKRIEEDKKTEENKQNEHT